MILLPREKLTVRAGQRWQSADVAIGALTSKLGLVITRPTLADDVGWRPSKIVASIVVSVDGVEYRLSGGATGGRRSHFAGGEQSFYRLVYGLPWGFFGRRSGFPARLCEGRSELRAWLEIEAVDDDVDTFVRALIETSAAPRVQFHSSVAFDAQSEASEVSGDGVLSTTHTATGADRAAFMACGNANGTGTGFASTSFTYNGVGGTELWDLVGDAGTTGQFCHNAAYRLAAPATGAQTVTNTLAGSPSEHVANVITLTGVDQTTPVGTAVTAVASTASPSVTVSSPGADDMVVDHLYYVDGQGAASTATPGANQTTRGDATEGTYNRSVISSQSGADGGVMSWSLSGMAFGAPEYGNAHGAVAFIAAGVGGGATLSTLMLMGVGA